MSITATPSEDRKIVEHRLAPKPVQGWQLDPNSPLHQLFLERMEEGRDLKIIITAKDAQTGTGKTTLAAGLALGWNPIYTGEPWTNEVGGTIDVPEYLNRYQQLQPGSVLLMEEAEQLDNRRPTSKKNVDFSHYWMTMRVRQVVSILTLPTTAALDSRLQMLADVWIDVERRGQALVHGIAVNSYNRNMYTPKKQRLEFPDISHHPEVEALAEMKEEKIERGLNDMEEELAEEDPDEARREEKVEFAQRLRDTTDMSGKEIGELVGRSDAWVYNNTEASDD